MRKILNGRRYDTDTAREMASWSNRLGYSDFGNCAETLYLKITGEYFLYGEGGPLTRYSESVPSGGWTGGYDIVPLAIEEAREWAESHCDSFEYEEIFGEVAE